MTISSFNISIDKTQLDLVMTDAADARVLRLWTDKTYKDFTVAIDLSSKLTGASIEYIEIALADIGIPYFDGIYFIEVEDANEIAQAMAWELTRYEECIVNRLGYLSVCNDCLVGEDDDLKNAFLFLEGLKTALENNLIDDIIWLNEVINKYCTNDCATCGKFSSLDDITSEDSVGGSTITIKLDGGSLD